VPVSLLDTLNKDEREESGKTYGVVVGVVSNTKDEEGLGRVKVDLPWRGEGGDESHWARVATLMAGNDRGTFIIPDVGDEVLVAFEHGDIGHPYVIGALWNGVDKPPESNLDGKNNIRKIRSRSGHEIIFEDNSEQKTERVEIRTNAGHRILLDDSAGQEKIEIVDKTKNNSIKINSTQNSVAIESGMNLKIKANMVEIEAGSMMTIKAGTTLTIQGTMVQIN
jgi:uncharacterized protein involved in type VI secretion and phage assembly